MRYDHDIMCQLAAWEHDLLEYSASHPEVRVIDSVHGIRTLRNRGTMLTVLKGNDITIPVSWGGAQISLS